ncbi:hypothetical protein LGH82_23550 [Mesorhizobium sp. PAMC28654]|uniref:hypothetical protein n=1 Tax=Mesorhizobium sp. PAMC28654 TaxID=2880934 RepID=UPI001D0A2543|nr:hypothetical protein [Mesorhizobium sp. PAMC28654]UDL88112.1 hypothetical protein LGH82_23550 [Mesorhizobium sp. PAMC28654]
MNAVIHTAPSEAAENWLHYTLTTRTDHQIRLPEALRQGRQAGHRAKEVVAAKRRLQRDGLIEIARDGKGKLVWRLVVEGRRAA